MNVIRTILLWLAVIVWYALYGVLVVLETIFHWLFTAAHFLRQRDASWFLGKKSWSRSWRRAHPKLSKMVQTDGIDEEVEESPTDVDIVEIPRETTIADIMTPRNQIASVKADEFLGPLVLDELAQTEHSCFPVIQGSLDHVVGTLDISDLLALDDKKSAVAHERMDRKVVYMPAGAGLRDGMEVLLKTKRHLAIVRNDEKRTVGLVTLSDILHKLFEEN